jgi:ribosomal protein S18 acetylase RimI-like enzyme
VGDGIAIELDGHDLSLVRELFTEYLDATIAETGQPNPDDSPEILAGMRRDIERLPGEYVSPDGALLVAWVDDVAAGSVALARIDDARAEIRRLWVRPTFRRRGVARALTLASIEHARTLGFDHVVLDVVPTRSGAIALYRALGFTDIDPYDDYPFEMVFLGRAIR